MMLDKSSITKAAQKFAAKGQIHKAIAEWEKLLNESEDGNIYNIIGDLYLKKKEKKKAMEAFTKAASIFREDGFYLKAIAIYKKVIHISPFDVNAFISLAELNAEKGLVSNANENFLAAAEIYIREGATEKALEIYEAILKLTPSNINLRLKIAELYQKIGLKQEAIKEYILVASDYLERQEYEKAQEFYLKIFGFDPQNITSLIGLGKIAEKTGDIKQAHEYLNNAMSIAPDNTDVLLNYSKLSLETNNIDAAKKALIDLVRIDPSNNQYKKLLGDIYLKQGLLEKAWEELLPYIDEEFSGERWSEALELLNNFKELDPIAVKSRLVTIYKGKNDKETAIKELRELVSIYENKDLPRETLQSYKELLELNPADEKIQVKIKKLEKKLGIKEPAAVAVPIENRSVEEVLPGADEYIRLGLLKEAISLLEKLKVKEPDNLEVLKRLKDVYIQSGGKDRAIGECLIIAELYEKRGDLDAKNSLIEEAKVLNPDDPRLVAVSMLSPELEKAAVVPKKDPVPPAGEPRESFEEKLAEADFYTQQGLGDEAITIYKELLSVSPDNEEIKKKLGALSPAEVPEEQPVEKAAADSTVDSDLKDIFKEFKKGIEDELGEQDSETRYNLGIAYKEMGLLEDAIREFKIAAKDPKKTVQSSSMLALCYMDKKLYPLAIQEFKKTVEAIDQTDKGYLGAKCDLADAYVKNNDYAKALIIYKEVHAQDPKFRDVARKVKIIKNLASEDKDKPKSKKDRVSYI